MAATSRHLSLAGRIAGWVFAALALLIAAFALAGWIGSAIPRNGEWREPPVGSADTVEIMVETNGVHTALVLPLVTAEKDWRDTFPAAHVPASYRPYTHVSVSWGERQVFLETPTWADLSPVTVLRIAGMGGEGLLHVAHYMRPAPSGTLRPLRLTGEQYRRLVASIKRDLPTRPYATHSGYGLHDVFYEAPGHYTVTNTCNQWTSDRLAEAGVRIGRWTPFAGGVMKWVPRPRGIG